MSCKNLATKTKLLIEISSLREAVYKFNKV